MKLSFKKAILSLTAILMTVFSSSLVAAQSPTPEPRSPSDTAKNRSWVTKRGLGANVTVVELGGKTFHGAISRIDADTFTVSEVDLKANIEIRYDQVKRLDKGYSHPDPITGKRMPPKTRKIIGWALAGAAIVLVTVIVVGLRDPDF